MVTSYTNIFAAYTVICTIIMMGNDSLRRSKTNGWPAHLRRSLVIPHTAQRRMKTETACGAQRLLTARSKPIHHPITYRAVVLLYSTASLHTRKSIKGSSLSLQSVLHHNKNNVELAPAHQQH